MVNIGKGLVKGRQCEDRIKQVPLVTVLMSRRTKKDYQAVFAELSRHLGPDIKLEDCVMDFKTATWMTLRAVFPGVSIHGCLFHFVQAVYRKVEAKYAIQCANY